MARKRRRFTAEFKGRVALETLRERDSAQVIAVWSFIRKGDRVEAAPARRRAPVPVVAIPAFKPRSE